jgi:hypothetical protein
MDQTELNEMKAEYEDMREGALMFAQAAALGEMLMRSEITLAEYADLVETMEKVANEKGVQIP